MTHRKPTSPQSSSRLGRRHFLRGAGGIIVGLPFLELFGSRSASAGPDDAPWRLLNFIHPQGTVWTDWRPTGAGSNFTLSPVLEPLAAHADQCVFVSGVANDVVWLNTNANAHVSAGRSLMTAHTFSNNFDAQGNLLPEAQRVPDGHAAGPSIDQVIAAGLDAPTPYRSLNFGVGGDHVNEYQMLFGAADDPISLDGDPNQVFTKLFTDSDPMSPSALEQIRAQRGSVLDAVLDNFNQLDARLGAADRQRLEAHANKIREIESNLDNTGQPGLGCATPSLALPQGFVPQTEGGLWDDSASRAFIDLMVMALACDMTRVGTLQYTNYHGPIFPWLGHAIPGGYDSWHTWVHGVADPHADPVVVDVFRWYMGELAYLLERLAETPEGESTLLDHMLVMSVSEFDNGSVHSAYSLPVILAGNLCGQLETGRVIDRDGHFHGELWTSIAQLFGIDIDCFGYAPLCGGPLSLA